VQLIFIGLLWRQGRPRVSGDITQRRPYNRAGTCMPARMLYLLGKRNLYGIYVQSDRVYVVNAMHSVR